ncbi:MAG: hypothetical protein EAZ55_01020 [Cytophagales bacterium]|nr:MAG: hypothetical protein EAZ55_01020 [Cytophagales bacterium]
MTSMNISEVEFKLVYQNPYASLYLNEALKLAVCNAEQEYIPIGHFKSVFLQMSALIEQNPIHYLIFDKRNLRTFHQPSMEWYFAVWKPEIKNKGLTHHFKILPNIPWFAKSVEAGKHEIFQKYGTDILEGIQITYVSSIEEVLELIPKK